MERNNNNTVNVIGSDHAPHTLKEKTKSGLTTSGLPGVQTTLHIMLYHINKKK